jgi:flagellin
MGLRISTNLQSMAAQRSLSGVKRSQDTAMEQLASGSRINRAGDDAAGLAISEKLKSNVRSAQQANRNAGDGISMIQVAEGGLNEISSILTRLRELSIQAASDTVGEKERSFSNMEFQNLTSEIQRISESTEFNGTKMLDGTGALLDFQIGINNEASIDRISFDSGAANSTAENLGMSGLSVLTKEDAQTNLSSIDQAIVQVNENRSNFGALQNRLQSTVNNLEVSMESLSAANSRIRDTDIAKASADLAKSSILTNAATSVLAQTNASNNVAMKLIG